MMSVDFCLKNKTIVFTGGGGHIVGELVRKFAELGANCISTDMREEKVLEQQEELKAKGIEIEVRQLDVTESKSWKLLLEKVVEKYGKIDGLINGAGINSPSTFFDIDVDVFRNIVDVNLIGTLNGCLVIGEHMVKNKRGSIVNISSTAAAPPLSKAFAYSASKAAVTNLTKNVARELGKTGVRVNSLRPGFFPTEWNKKNFLSPERTLSILNHTPMGRFGEVCELVGAVQWLISDASSFVTGSEVIVDGGFSAQTI
jgi:NAD(P)-dependent dehydrogenase (short-subunit alcohol dehydrogenase family)